MTIRTNTTNNSAIFTFEPLFKQDTYVCHFVAEDSSNWIKTAMTWERIALSTDLVIIDDKIKNLSAEIEQLKNSIK